MCVYVRVIYCERTYCVGADSRRPIDMVSFTLSCGQRRNDTHLIRCIKDNNVDNGARKFPCDIDPVRPLPVVHQYALIS